MKIVLASASPRRKELLKLIFNDFEVRPADISEELPDDIFGDKAAEYLACAKADSLKASEEELLIACDTVVVFEEKILGKPENRDQCRKMLKILSGNTHFVYTGVCILGGGQRRSFTEKTEVTFNLLSEEEIENYMNTGEPFDKAGGYGIQGRGALLVKCICGDYFNVVGLPVSRLNREILDFKNGIMKKIK